MLKYIKTNVSKNAAKLGKVHKGIRSPQRYIFDKNDQYDIDYNDHDDWITSFS